jgi:hypothetical protein
MPRSEPDHLVDAATAAHYVAHLRHRPCAPGTIWSWASRGHIRRYGRGRYDIREIEAWTRRLMMDDLIAFLRQQLDEDERVAREAGAGSWSRDDTYPDSGGIISDTGTIVYDEGSPSQPQAEHIARWDPARALAEIQAKRRILDWLERWDDRMMNDNYWPWDSTEAVEILAQTYAGRPGWREEWRVDQGT